MARQLVDEVPAFREALDRALPLAEAALGVDLRAWLVAADPADTEVAQLLAQTRYAQPALFSVSYALAAWLDSLGIRPDAMIGHSIGEYAAACHAGVFSLEDAMAAVIARGQAMFDQPAGAMLAVRTGVDAVRALLPEGIEVAGCNAPALTVVAGGHEAIDRFAQALERSEIDATRLRVSHAFHSASMEGALPRVTQALAQARLQAPRLTVYSCVSGAPLQAHEATDPGYWARQVRAPVLFSHTGVKALHDGDRDLTDAEIKAIAADGGVIGIWPNGESNVEMADMVRHIDYVRRLVGVNHVGIGSDLRGMSRYTAGFGEEANFRAIAEALLASGYTDDDVGKVMGGNFMRVWGQVLKEAHP